MTKLIQLPNYYQKLPTEAVCYLVFLTLRNGGKVEITLEINWPILKPHVLHKLLKNLAKKDENVIAIENIDNVASLRFFLIVSAAQHVYPQLLALNEEDFYLSDKDFFKDKPWASSKSFTLLEAHLKTSIIGADWTVTNHTVPF